LPALDGYWARGDFNSWIDGHYLCEDYHDKSISLKVAHQGGDSGIDKQADHYKALSKIHSASHVSTEAKLSK
jgi:hypothetical protein